MAAKYRPIMETLSLNERALGLVEELIQRAAPLRIQVDAPPDACRVLDLGVRAPGGLEAGRLLAEICLAGLARVVLVPAPNNPSTGLSIQVTSDQPVAACMAAQYAGWEVRQGKYFAMGSGPMRAAASKEALFDTIGFRERPAAAVGVLETRKLPPPEVCQYLAEACGVSPERLTLLIAPTASQAGTLQIVARSVETALHKLLELGFDLTRIQSAHGQAPLPPVAADDLAAIGRTNDAILYGGEVTLWVRGDDASLEEIGPRVPSSASRDHGRPFAELFRAAGHDFYRMDPQLFSPAVVSLINLDTGRNFRFGQLAPDVLGRSFQS